MEHLDRLIPLAILAAIGVFVLVLLRRSAPRQKTSRRAAESLPVIPVAQPAVVMLDVPTAKMKRRKLRRKRAPAVVGPAALPRTTIDTVLGLLREKDTLAAAFLLREILAPPVSRRR